MRVLSLLPSATEIGFALGLGDDLVGVTHECDYPPEARTKPVAITSALPSGPLHPQEVDRLVRERMDRQEPIYEIDRELVRRAQPELILAQDLCRVCAVPSGQVEVALADLGCTAEVLSLDPPDLQGILRSIEQVGRATGTETRAARITESLRRRIEAVRARAASLPPVRTLCLEWLDPPFAGGHWVPEMAVIAGGKNLLSEPGARSRSVSWPEIVDARPDVVVFMPCGYSLPRAEEEASGLYEIPEFRRTPAGASGRVFAVDASSYFSRPGPRIVDGLEILAWAIHPESFPEPPPDTVAVISGDGGL